jgi:hypothetical protein
MAITLSPESTLHRQIFDEGVCRSRHRGHPQHRRQRAHRQVFVGKRVGRPQQPLRQQPGAPCYI